MWEDLKFFKQEEDESIFLLKGKFPSSYGTIEIEAWPLLEGVRPKPKLSKEELFQAVQTGSLLQLQLHAQVGGQFSVCNAQQDTLVHIAIRLRKEAVLAFLLENPININQCNKKNLTPLELAIKKKRVRFVEMLLHRGVRLDHINSKGQTPLHLAVRSGNLKLVQLLLNYNANADARDKANATPAAYAVLGINPDIAILLAKHQKNLNIQESDKGNTLLHLAAHEENHEMVKFLLQQNVKIDIYNKKSMAPIHIAAQQGSVRCCKLLLEYNNNYELTDNLGNTPLHYAASSLNTKVLEFFIEQKLPIDTRNTQGNSPLMVAVACNNYRNVEKLVEAGALIDAQNNNGYTPLHFASRKGYSKIINYLRDKGASDLQDKNSRTPDQLKELYKKEHNQLVLEEDENMLISKGISAINSTETSSKKFLWKFWDSKSENKSQGLDPKPPRF